MGLKEMAVGRSDVFKVDPRKLKIQDGLNPRMESPAKDEHIRTLADSIKAVGVRMPLLVRVKDDEIFVVDGECRLRGTLLAISEGADIKAVPVTAEDRYANDQDRMISILVHNDGLPLTMLEQGGAYKQLLGWGWSEVQIAAKVGRSVTHVKTALNLTTVSPEILSMVQSGTVSPTTAMKVIKEKGPEKAVGALKDAVGVSAALGKTKATAKHLDRKPGTLDIEPKVNWKKYGPMFKTALESIRDAPINSAKLAQAISAGNELLSQFEDDHKA